MGVGGGLSGRECCDEGCSDEESRGKDISIEEHVEIMKRFVESTCRKNVNRKET